MGKGLLGLLGLKGYVPGLFSAIFNEVTLHNVEQVPKIFSKIIFC
jgi:hypothetical protein